MEKTLLLDLQLFADEEVANDVVPDEDTAPEEVIDDTELTDDEIISRDVFNVSEDTLNDLRAEYGDDFVEEKEPPEEESAPPTAEDKPDVETQPLDYKSLYEQQQKELEELKSRLATPQPATADNQQQTPVTDVVNGEVPNSAGCFRLTPEANKLFNDIVRARTLEILEISGLSEEDLDTIGYLDDSDEKKQLFFNAQSIARQEVVNQVQQQTYAIQQQQYQQQLMQQQAQADIQSFVNEVKATPNYEVIDKYVTNTFLGTLSPMDQQVVREAYIRANNGQSTPQDNAILRYFWREGQNAYNNQMNPTQSVNTNRTQAKMQQRNAMPRVGNITGANSNVNEWDNDRIAKALENGNWEKIPQPVIDRFLRGS